MIIRIELKDNTHREIHLEEDDLKWILENFQGVSNIIFLNDDLSLSYTMDWLRFQKLLNIAKGLFQFFPKLKK